jgi:hypothetical protein
MPEEPDVSPEELEILDRVLLKQIEARKHQRQREAEQINSVADQILAVLKTRPQGMTAGEIRTVLGEKYSDEQISEALLALMKKPLAMTRQKVEKTAEPSGERFLLAAS